MKHSRLFNSPIEVGLRSLLILLEAHPRPLDLQRLVILDYLLVHSGDVLDGPESLHPPSPLRAGEVAIRRDLIQQGLHLMASKGLVSRIVDERGICYIAEESAPSLTDAFRTPYVRVMRQRAAWAVEAAASLSDTAASAMFGETIERWRSEFVALATEDEI
jgi:hypothetical protein